MLEARDQQSSQRDLAREPDALGRFDRPAEVVGLAADPLPGSLGHPKLKGRGRDPACVGRLSRSRTNPIHPRHKRNDEPNGLATSIQSMNGRDVSSSFGTIMRAPIRTALPMRNGAG